MLNFGVIAQHPMGRCKEENEVLLVGRARLSDAADARWLQARTQLFSVDTALGSVIKSEYPNPTRSFHRMKEETSHGHITA